MILLVEMPLLIEVRSGRIKIKAPTRRESIGGELWAPSWALLPSSDARRILVSTCAIKGLKCISQSRERSGHRRRISTTDVQCPTSKEAEVPRRPTLLAISALRRSTVLFVLRIIELPDCIYEGLFVPTYPVVSIFEDDPRLLLLPRGLIARIGLP